MLGIIQGMKYLLSSGNANVNLVCRYNQLSGCAGKLQHYLTTSTKMDSSLHGASSWFYHPQVHLWTWAKLISTILWIKCDTYCQLSRPMETLNLIYSITDVAQDVIKFIPFHHVARSMHDEHRIRAYIEIDLSICLSVSQNERADFYNPRQSKWYLTCQVLGTGNIFAMDEATW